MASPVRARPIGWAVATTGREQITLNANAAALAVVDEKVDRLEIKLDAYIERAEPMMDFYSAGASLLRWIKWILGLGASAAAIVLGLKALGVIPS